MTTTTPNSQGAAATPRPAGKSVGSGNARKWLTTVGLGVALIGIVVGLLVWRPWHTEPPRLNEEPYKIAQFVVGEEFQKLPFERQFTYMELLDDKEDALVQAYADQKLSDAEYGKALQAAHLGQELKRARNFATKPTPRARESYLDERLQKKKKSKTSEPKKSDSKSALTADEVKRDDSDEQATLDRWPVEAMAQLNAYRTALKQRKESLKEQKEAAIAATQPAKTQPSKTQPASSAAAK